MVTRNALFLAASVVTSVVFSRSASAQFDVTAPGDPLVILPAGSTAPGGEGVDKAIDNTTTKYLNFEGETSASGFIVTPALGSTVVSGLRLYTANDAVARDPSSYRLEGSTTGAGGTFTLISEGPLALPDARNAPSLSLDPAARAQQTLAFANSTAYTSYRLLFPSIKGPVNSADNAGGNSMQIGEVELLSAVPEPGSAALIGVAGMAIAMRRRRAR